MSFVRPYTERRNKASKSIVLVILFFITFCSCSLRNLVGNNNTSKDNIGPFSVWDGYTREEVKLSGNAYEIKKASELVWLSEQPVYILDGKTIKLTINIDLVENEFNGFANLSPQNIFKSSFDGNKKIVKNFVIHKGQANYVGFIGYMASTATVRDLYIENATIKAEGNGFGAVGSIVGFNDGGVVYGCYSTADVIVNTDNVKGVGGIIGYNRNGRLSSSYNAGNIITSRFAIGVGGLVGYIENFGSAEILNSYNIGDVSGGESVGGLVGYNKDSKISKSYNTGYVEGRLFIGGLVGYNTGDIEACYYNDALSSRDSIGAGKGSGVKLEALNERDFSALDSFANYYKHEWIVMTALYGNISVRPVLINVGKNAIIR